MQVITERLNNLEGLSLKKRVSAITEAQRQIEKANKRLFKKFAMRAKESSKVYKLGLRDWISRKLKTVDLGSDAVAKLEQMLMDHHVNRIRKIEQMK